MNLDNTDIRHIMTTKSLRRAIEAAQIEEMIDNPAEANALYDDLDPEGFHVVVQAVSDGDKVEMVLFAKIEGSSEPAFVAIRIPIEAFDECVFAVEQNPKQPDGGWKWL